MKGRWGLGVGASFLYYIISSVSMFVVGLLVMFSGIFLSESVNASSSVAGDESLKTIGVIFYILTFVSMSIVILVVKSIMDYGYCNLTLRLAKKESTTIGNLFEGFYRKNVFRLIKLALLMFVYTFLWGLLFIIPGIIKLFSYSMSYYILLDNPECTASEAIKKSKEMMKGHKWDLFVLSLSFIGWLILCVITWFFIIGIPFLWFYPYYFTTVSDFYLKLVNKGAATEEETVI